jgi:hypothetical protein
MDRRAAIEAGHSRGEDRMKANVDIRLKANV